MFSQADHPTSIPHSAKYALSALGYLSNLNLPVLQAFFG
jgi:hypothetical protein